MLRVSIRQMFDKDHQPEASFFTTGLMTRRPEQLTIEEFVALTNDVEKWLR